ncbi:hypothetical protein [Epilithonimonas caeni]|uniref:hypothetical protein n=1 Tax=Epilithonimonas caeni TaxID=365343 RepID=UPI0012EC70A0|nr:hypothetical protein [Epilithonimonas caeni]
MKHFNFLTFIMSCLLLTASCSRSDDEKDESTTSSCKNVNGLKVIQSGEYLNFTIDSNESGPYEIGVNQTGNGVPYSGFVVNEKTYSQSINNISNGQILTPGTSYSFFVRKICSSESKSDWGFEKSITISNNFCKKPYEVKVEDFYNRIQWKINNYENGQSPSYYQIQYGEQGFSLGTGTVIDTSQDYYNAPFVAGKKYDIYVRSYCAGTAGWGEWTKPVTFLASITTACVAPTYANYTTTSVNSSYYHATINWENDGVSQYQISLSVNSGLPTSATLYEISAPNAATYTNLVKGTTYYFYARKKCTSNTYSNYYGPYIVKW